ncbi:MAG: hypothetical protein MJ123_06250 [Lachnospiraceae bacterium]|nr:hypothetical protein [Lachnospiraceae bacterium]
MAKEVSPSDAQKKQLKEDRKKLREEEKKQKKEIKQRAKELSKREAEIEDEEDSGGGVSSALVTTVIIIVWIAILCFLIKLDFWGFGSEILAPLLKDVPVVNKILPDSAVPDIRDDDAYGGYTSLREAVDYIRTLELELEHAQKANTSDTEELTALKAEIERLQEFEAMQKEFQRIKEQFYEEIIYSENGPGAEEYRKYYESIDPATAEALYKQVVRQLEEDNEIKEFAATYSAMKPKQAAGIFEQMTDNLNLVAKILNAMDTDTRGSILGVMDATVASKLTKIMDPEG